MKPLQHLYEVQQLGSEHLKQISLLAQAMEGAPHKYTTRLSGKRIATLFYEPSTRTRLSFEAAALALGGTCVSTENAREFSSAAKGETLRDTIRVVSGYVDAIALRYDRTGGAEEAARYSSVPVINAGDGTGQHPTQALLDIYTILKHHGVFREKTVALVGDLANGRTVHSLAYLIAKHYPENHLVLVSPAAVRMPEDILAYLDRKRVAWRMTDHWDEVLEEADVVYMTRVQQERFKEKPELHREVCHEAERLNLTPEVVGRMKHSAIILHPLPRLAEIDPAVDHDHRACYFEQTRNGLFVRMALLEMMLNPN